jgi:hypothetical protein
LDLEKPLLEELKSLQKKEKIPRGRIASRLLAEALARDASRISETLHGLGLGKEVASINRPAGRERHELDEAHGHSKRSPELDQGNHLIFVDAAQQDAVEFHHFKTRDRSGMQ